MERIPHRDLRNKSSEILREVAAGASYEITNHGKVVAILSPPTTGARLRLRPPRRRGGWHQIPRVSVSESVTEMLDDLRGDR